jgi:rhodanese-related sulfurtransferase
MKKLFSLVVTLVFMLVGAATVSAWEYIHAEDAYVLLQQEDVYLVDVRTPSEWHWIGHPGPQTINGTVEGAFLEGKVIHIPYWQWGYDEKTQSWTFFKDTSHFDEQVVRAFDPGDTLIIMCKTDGRGGMAADQLEPNPPEPSFLVLKRLAELGYYSLYNLGGGFMGSKVHNDIPYVGWQPSGLPYNTSDEGIWKPYYHLGGLFSNY